jgi:uncharacterized membrane protein
MLSWCVNDHSWNFTRVRIIYYFAILNMLHILLLLLLLLVVVVVVVGIAVSVLTSLTLPQAEPG